MLVDRYFYDARRGRSCTSASAPRQPRHRTTRKRARRSGRSRSRSVSSRCCTKDSLKQRRDKRTFFQAFFQALSLDEPHLQEHQKALVAARPLTAAKNEAASLVQTPRTIAVGIPGLAARLPEVKKVMRKECICV